MNDKRPLLDDITKLAGSVVDTAVHTALDTKHQLESWVQEKCQAFCVKQQLVTREEFEVVRQMVQHLRLEQESLKQELEILKKSNSSHS